MLCRAAEPLTEHLPQMKRSQFLKCSVAFLSLGMLVLTGASYYETIRGYILAKQVPMHSAVRVPQLDGNNRIFGWIGQDQLVVSSAPGCIPTDYPFYWVDLRTGSSKLLTTEPTNDFGNRYDGHPYPSPDGKWLLSQQVLFTQQATPKELSRWRLERSDGSGSVFLPQNKAFVSTEITVGIPAWLPDSRGWIVYDPFKPDVFLYDLTRPNAKPKRIPVPCVACWIPTKDWHLVGVPSSRKEIIFFSLKDGSTRSLPLTRPAEWGKKFHPYKIAISQEGNWAVVSFTAGSPEFVSTVNRMFHSSGLVSSHRLIRLSDGSSKELPWLTLGSAESILPDFALSPNGKKLIWWDREGAWLTSL